MLLCFFSDFESLIPGQGWLVRNGKSYIEENLSKVGDNEDFTIPIKEIFHTVKTTDIAPRSVIGYDKDGKLLLLQIDGQFQHKGINPFPDSSFNHGSGMTIFEISDFAVELGFFNAINLNVPVIMSQNKTIISVKQKYVILIMIMMKWIKLIMKLVILISLSISLSF